MRFAGSSLVSVAFTVEGSVLKAVSASEFHSEELSTTCLVMSNIPRRPLLLFVESRPIVLFTISDMDISHPNRYRESTAHQGHKIIHLVRQSGNHIQMITII
jgi:hypothetical protein